MTEGESVVKAMQEVSNLSCEDCKHYNQRLKECVLGKHCEEARAVLFEAASKQVAVSPHMEGDGYDAMEMVYDVWVCPSCGKDYEFDYEKHIFCPNCGQKIECGEPFEEVEE